MFYKPVYLLLSDSFEIDVNLIQFTSAIEKYWIIRENIYNFDEKGFMIRVGITVIQVMTLKEMKSREIMGANQDRNREWVSLLAAVYAIAMKILLIPIYQGKSRDLQDS